MTLRFSRRAALVLGLLLPLLEAWRRRHQWSEPRLWPMILDDFVAGGLLLAGAISTGRSPERGRPLLAAAWGVVCAGMYFSFYAQLAAAQDPSGLPSRFVAGVKVGILLLTLAGLVGAVRAPGGAP